MRILLASSVIASTLALTAAANAQTFTAHGGVIVRGGHEVTGNALLRCPSGSSCINNNTELVPVNVDALPLSDLDGNGTDDTTMSSAGTLTIPNGAKVVSARVYYSVTAGETTAWTGAPWVPTSAANAPLLFGRTGGAYTKVTPEHFSSLSNGLIFEGRYDVTALVPGSGEYWVANAVMPPSTHKLNRDALWVLVVIYDDGTATRLVQTWDGIYHCNGVAAQTMTLTGFRTPAAGALDAKFSLWGQDGASGTAGETATLGTTQLSNTLNPANNIGNGTMSRVDGTELVRNPSTKPHLEGPEIDTFDASAAFTNGQSGTTFTLACSKNDGLFWVGAALSVAVQAPEMVVTKTATDLDGGSLVAGDELRYDIVVENKGSDDAIDVVLRDAIPEHTTFVPGSIEVEAGQAFAALTDAKGDDAAEIDGRNLVVRLGASANVTTGGDLEIGTSAKLRFRVKVDALTESVSIVNRAEVTVRAAAGGSGGPALTTPSRDGAGNEATTLDAVPCAPGAGAQTAPGCTEAAPVCLAGEAPRCVQCSDDGDCSNGEKCVSHACSGGGGTTVPSADAGTSFPAGPESIAPDADTGCGCRTTPASASSATIGGGLFAIAVAGRLRRRRASR